MQMTLDVEEWDAFFPYTPRPLQTTMLKIITKMLEREVHMVMEAANGTGKTIAALSSILPYAKRNGYKIVYLARTHTQMDRVVEELQQINNKTPVSGLALRGRKSMCLNSLVKDYATNNKAVQVMCSQLKSAKKCDYYNNLSVESRVLPVLGELSRKPVTAEIILDMAEAAYICPAETARLVIPKVDVIACSYLYLFDPVILPPFLDALECELEDLIVVIDECHNLPDAVGNINSTDLSTFTFNRAINEARRENKYELVRFLETCNAHLIEKAKNLKFDREIPIDPAIFLEEIYELLEDIETDEKFFDEIAKVGSKIRFRRAKQGKEPQSSLGRVGDFFVMWFMSIGKASFTHSLEKKKFRESRDSFVTLRLSALDPSLSILPILERVHNTLSMSGSLGDPEAYMMLTGLDRVKSMSNILPSPYREENIKAIVTRELTTTYKKRSPEMWTKIVNSIAAVANNTPANVGVFAPSYSILKQLMRNGLESKVYKDIVYLKSGISSEKSDKLIKKFKRKAKDGGALLVSVLGGRTSEGADFPGDLMNSVIVVGIPYAPPNCRIDAQIKYLEDKFPGRGRTLAYQIPAINRASQAAGRPVRSLQDRAFILLVDYRFGFRNVAIHLPGWLRASMRTMPYNENQIAHEVKSFYVDADVK